MGGSPSPVLPERPCAHVAFEGPRDVVAAVSRLPGAGNRTSRIPSPIPPLASPRGWPLFCFVPLIICLPLKYTALSLYSQNQWQPRILQRLGLNLVTVWSQTGFFFGLVSYLALHGLGRNGLPSIMGWLGVDSGYKRLVGFGIGF